MKGRGIVKISTLASLVIIVSTLFAMSGKMFDIIDNGIEKKITAIIDKDPRWRLLDKIKKDTEEIKLLIAIMNRDNPEYQKAVEALRTR